MNTQRPFPHRLLKPYDSSHHSGGGSDAIAIVRNQEYAIEVLLSPKLPHVGKTIRSVFGEGKLCEAPEKVCAVLVALIAQGNKLTPAQLQSNDLTLDKAATQVTKYLASLLAMCTPLLPAQIGSELSPQAHAR